MRDAYEQVEFDDSDYRWDEQRQMEEYEFSFYHAVHNVKDAFQTFGIENIFDELPEDMMKEIRGMFP